MALYTYPVGGEGDVGSAEEAGAEHVAQGVVFLMEGKDSRGRQA